MQIYIAKNGKQTGPFTEDQTRDMVASGSVSPDDLGWSEGAADWRPLRLLLDLSQLPPVLNPSVQEVQGASRPSTGPKGVGGWLVFFCIAITILIPVANLLQMAIGWSMAEDGFARYPLLKGISLWENFGWSVLFVYGIIVGCIIWSGSPKGRSVARVFLMVRLFAFIGVEVVALLMLLTGDLPGEVIAFGFFGAFGVCINAVGFCLAWWFYFKKSERVRNTYGDERA